MKKTKIYIIALLLIVFIVPSVALAAWWNPFSWSFWNIIFHTQTTTTQNNTNTSQGGNSMNPPQLAIDACSGKVAGDVCSFSDNGKTASGVCDIKPGVIACAPNKSNNETGGAQNNNSNINTGSAASATLSTAANSCINNTKDNPKCKDCCDCLSGTDSAARTLCRNTCATHDFTKNSNFITVTVPSTLGKNGDYSKALSQTTVDKCKIYCENSMSLKCGDYQYCRMACDNKWGIEPGPSGQTTSQSSAGSQNTATSGTSNATPPAAAISACIGKASGATCSFSNNGTTTQGTCDTKPGVLACNPGQGSSNQTSGQQANNQGSTGGQNEYTIAQAISDNAQLNTMSFDGLGFLTGNTCSDSFLPPGKVADFFGFQHLRDITADGKGHDTDFVTNSANNVLKTLTTAQKAKMLALAKSQGASVNQFAYDRFPLMVAFRRQMTGDIPSGTTGLSKSAVMSYSSDLYELDAEISIQRAQLYASILNSLDSTQKTFLDGMVKGGFASWASLPNQVDAGLSREESVLMMTYASEMFGWYAGDLEADTYFCPERQADYFGGFYIKDAPAIGNAGYTIDESITGDQGQAFLNALDTTQKSTVTSVLTTQKTALNGIVDKRRAISTELRKALTGGTIDEAMVTSLARQYGAYDGEISYYYATAFSNVYKTLTTTQKTALANLKGLSNYPCPSTSAYLYSEKINMPTVENTDFLFK